MIASQVEDLIRLKLGVPDLAPDTLKLVRQLARSEIESIGNFHWQAAHIDIMIPVSVADFNVKVDFIVPDFQEFRFIQLQRNSRWRTIMPGSWLSTLEGVEVVGTGFPERCTYENGTLKVSPIPDDSYEGNLFYFAATEEPEDITNTDDLYTLWPQLIFYASMAIGQKIVKEDPTAARVWESLMQDQADKALEYTSKLLGEPSGQISASTAAKILQASGGGQ